MPLKNSGPKENSLDLRDPRRNNSNTQVITQARHLWHVCEVDEDVNGVLPDGEVMRRSMKMQRPTCDMATHH